MKDSTLMAKPLYNACNSALDGGEAVQLYFGPGFEDRIEMEMDQIIMGKKKGYLSEKEKKIRAEEEEMFNKLKSPPVLLEGVLDVLGDDHKTDELVKQRVLDKQKLRKIDEKGWETLERAAMNLGPVKKKRKKPGTKTAVLVPLPGKEHLVPLLKK